MTTSLLAEWAPPGSDWYYALARVTPKQKHAIVALYAYAQTLHHIAERYHEPGIAEIKLHWWQDEIERVFQQQAQHPIGQALQISATQFALNKTALLALIEAASLSLKTQRFETQNQLAQHYQHTGGIMVSQMATVLHNAPLNGPIETYTHTLGIALETIRHIIDTPYYLARQHLYFPTQTIEQAHIDLNALMQKPQGDRQLKTLLQQQAKWAREQYQQALMALPKDALDTPKPLLIYAKLQFKKLDKIERDGLRVCERRLELSPLAKWWHVL